MAFFYKDAEKEQKYLIKKRNIIERKNSRNLFDPFVRDCFDWSLQKVEIWNLKRLSKCFSSKLLPFIKKKKILFLHLKTSKINCNFLPHSICLFDFYDWLFLIVRNDKNFKILNQISFKMAENDPLWSTFLKLIFFSYPVQSNFLIYCKNTDLFPQRK